MKNMSSIQTLVAPSYEVYNTRSMFYNERFITNTSLFQAISNKQGLLICWELTNTVPYKYPFCTLSDNKKHSLFIETLHTFFISWKMQHILFLHYDYRAY